MWAVGCGPRWTVASSMRRSSLQRCWAMHPDETTSATRLRHSSSCSSGSGPPGRDQGDAAGRRAGRTAAGGVPCRPRADPRRVRRCPTSARQELAALASPTSPRSQYVSRASMLALLVRTGAELGDADQSACATTFSSPMRASCSCGMGRGVPRCRGSLPLAIRGRQHPTMGRRRSIISRRRSRSRKVPARRPF